MFIFELEQTGNLVIAHFIVFDLLFDEIVQGDLVVVDHVVRVYNVIIAGQVLVVSFLGEIVRLPQVHLAQVALLEIRVTHCLSWSYPLSGVHPQHLLQKVQSLLVDLPEVPPLDRLQVVNLGELHADELGVLQKVLVVLGSQGAKTLLNQIKLIQVIFSREERLPVDHFCHDAANRPNIDGLVVVVPANQQFGRAVPPGGHVVGHDPVGGHCPGESQVAYFNSRLLSDEDVFGLDVPVDGVDAVHVGDALEELVGVVLDVLGVDLALFQNFQQIFLNVLADEIDPPLLAEGLLQLDDILVAQHFEDLDFPQDDLFVLFVRIAFFELFDGDDLAGLFISGLEDHSVLPLPDLVDYFVFVHEKQQFQRINLLCYYPPKSQRDCFIHKTDHHRERRVLLVSVRMFIFCYPVIKSSTFDSCPCPPSSLLTLLMNSVLDSNITLLKSTSFLKFRWIFDRPFDLFCRVKDFMQGKLINSLYIFTFVSPNSLQMTYSPLSSRKAQPAVWNYSSKNKEFVMQHLIIELGEMHSWHQNLRKRRSPESILDMMVSSA